MREPAEPYVFRRWVAGAVMDGGCKAGRGGNTVFRLYALYQQPQPSEWSFRKATVCLPFLPFSSSLAVRDCRTHTCAVCEPARPVIYSHGAFRTNLRERLSGFGDNSGRICLGAVAVLWPRSRHDADVWWSLLLVDLVQLPAARRLPSPVFVVCSDVSPYSVICSMTGICFCWGQEDTTIACLLRANISSGRQHSPEQIDSYAAGLFGWHEILSSWHFFWFVMMSH